MCARWWGLAKAHPGELNYASGGPGSTSHFAVAMFVALAGIQKRHGFTCP